MRGPASQFAGRTAAALARGAHRPRGRGAGARPDLPRRRRGRRPRPPRPADPGLPRRRRLALDDGRLAQAHGLPAEPRGHRLERELRRRPAAAARGAARAAGGAAGAAGGDRRPEPRRHARQGAGAPAAGPRVRRGGARLAAGGPAGRAPAGPAPGGGGQPARLARRPGPVQALVPRRRLLLVVLGGPRAAAAARRRLVSVYSKSDGVVDWRSCLDPSATRLVEIRASHCGMAVSRAAWRAVADALESFRAAEARRRRPAGGRSVHRLPRAA